MLKELEILIKENNYIKNNSEIYGFKDCYGINTPLLRNIAKTLAFEKRYDFLNEKHTCFEEKIIHAYMLSYIKEDISFLLNETKKFIPQIDNWAVNDALSQLKFAKKHQKEVFNFLLSLKDSDDEWEVRFVAVTMLSNFLNDEYINKVINVISYLKANTYMSKMGVAWLVATMMAKYPDKTYEFLNNNNLDNWTYNKSIQKMLESFRVSPSDKEKLRNMKRK